MCPVSAVVSSRPGVSHGQVLCPQARGHGFRQPAYTGRAVEPAEEKKKTEHGVGTIFLPTQTRESIKK